MSRFVDPFRVTSRAGKSTAYSPLRVIPPARARECASARIAAGQIACVPAPPDDVIEIDEACIRVTPALWLWVAVSRLVGQVLSFVIGNRTDAMLALCWSDVPQDYRDKPVCTDHWGALTAGSLPVLRATMPTRGLRQGERQDESQREGWNTIRDAQARRKWRQPGHRRWPSRQSGLVRRSCGVCGRIETDLVERFLLLVDGHNRARARRWNRQQPTGSATL